MFWYCNLPKKPAKTMVFAGVPSSVEATGGCIALAVCAYFFGYYVLRSQSSPYRLQLRVFLVAGMLVCTCVVTASAWLFLGGLDSCRAFDTSMMNSQGYTFDHLWAMLCVRYGVNWCLTLIGIFLLLADHPPSTYIRHCIRCCLCLYMSQVVITLGMTWNACTGADVNEDGVRDSILEGSANLQESLAAGMEVSGTLLFFLSGNWFLQIVVKMMRALEAAFGEPLPRFTTIVYLNHFVVAMTIVSAAILRLPLLFLQAGVIVALALIALTALEFLALGVPLRALQGAMCDDDTGAPLEKLKIAKSTLRRFQAAIVLRNLTTVFLSRVGNLQLFWGILFPLKSQRLTCGSPLGYRTTKVLPVHPCLCQRLDLEPHALHAGVLQLPAQRCRKLGSPGGTLHLVFFFRF